MASSDRVIIADELAADILFQSDRTCCVCRNRVHRVQIHHIDEVRSNSSDPDNLVALCLVCHDDAHLKGGFTRKLDATTIKKYRDEWYKTVLALREEAARFSTQNGLPEAKSIRPLDRDQVSPLENKAQIDATLKLLPALRKAAFDRARPLWDSGNNASMRRGTYDVQYVTENMLVTLLSWYPNSRFGGLSPKNYVSEYKSERARFHWDKAQPFDEPMSRMGRLIALDDVLADLESMVVDLAKHLHINLSLCDFQEWKLAWDQGAKRDE